MTDEQASVGWVKRRNAKEDSSSEDIWREYIILSGWGGEFVSELVVKEGQAVGDGAGETGSDQTVEGQVNHIAMFEP